MTSTLIHEARKRGLTQEVIAARSRTTQPTIARLMAGDYKFDSNARRKVDTWLKEWLQAVEFQGEVYLMRGGV